MVELLRYLPVFLWLSFFLAELLIALDFVIFVLNCEAIHYLKDLLFFLAINLFHLDS